jgi:hypothetical protein
MATVSQDVDQIETLTANSPRASSQTEIEGNSQGAKQRSATNSQSEIQTESRII